MACLLHCDLKVKEWLFVECLLAGNFLHWFRCHTVVTRRRVYVLAQGEKRKINKCLSIHDSITMSLFLLSLLLLRFEGKLTVC